MLTKSTYACVFVCVCKFVCACMRAPGLNEKEDTREERKRVCVRECAFHANSLPWPLRTQ